MTYEPGALREESGDLVTARKWAVGLLVAAFGASIIVSEIQRVQAIQDPMKYAYLGLLLLTVILAFLWIWATQKELDLLLGWLDPEDYQPPSSFRETAIILGLGVLLVALLFASRDPLLYGIVFTAYSAVQLPAFRYLRQHIRYAIEQSMVRIDSDSTADALRAQADVYRRGVQVLGEYFIVRPLMLRLVVILLWSIVALGFAIHWKVSGSVLSGMTSYGIFLTTILVSEIVIGRWRIIRDDALRIVRQDLRRVLRELESGGKD